jgi:hypothetical protein
MTRHQPQLVTGARDAVRLALVYKNFAAAQGISHIGLGVAALNTSITLRGLGYWVEVWPCNTSQDIVDRIESADAQAIARGEHPMSHVVISAPWVPTPEMQAMLMRYPAIHFAMVSHSNIGFLMADPNGIRLLRQGVELELGNHNFALGGNSMRFKRAWTHMYGARMLYLPNLYDLSSFQSVGQRPPWEPGHVLRIGIFGATRPLKNMVTAAAAAVELGSSLKNDVEIWVSSGRTEGGGTVKEAIKQITESVPHVTLIEAGWRSWPEFRQIVRNMHLLISPSYTESFSMVTADGVAEGVASVVSEAIDWTPPDWIASVDDVDKVTRTARRLLHDAHAVDDGQTALRLYVEEGSKSWEDYLLGVTG